MADLNPKSTQESNSVTDSTAVAPQSVVAGGVEVTTDELVNRRGRTVLIVALVLLILIMLATCFLAMQLLKPAGEAADDTGGITWLRSIYAFGPSQSQAIIPASCDVVGNSYFVADQEKFRIVEFRPNGTFKSLFTNDADGRPLDFPSDIDATTDGWLYVAQSTYDNIKVYDNNRKLVQTLKVPRPMSVDANDEMVVVGAAAGVVAFDRDGNTIGYLGERGDAEDNFDIVNGVALDDDNNFYVVDSYNNRLSKYNEVGDRVWMVEMGPPSNNAAAIAGMTVAEIQKKYKAAMQIPMGITIDGAGRLVVIDSLDFSIAAFSPKDGSFLGKWGAFGKQDGQLSYASDIAYDKTRDVFFLTDTGNARAQIVKIPGSGGNALTALNQFLSGPLSACIVPLIILIILLIAWFVYSRYRKKRIESRLVEEASAILEAKTAEHDAVASGQNTDLK